jgi:uncharacterized caspase-like protein
VHLPHNTEDSFVLQPDAPDPDPESTGSGVKGNAGRDFAQLEALLAGRMKSLESDLTTTRRELAESRQQEVKRKAELSYFPKSET